MDINTEIDRKEQILKLISRFSDKPSKTQVALFFEKYHSQDIAEQLESLEINEIISFLSSLTRQQTVDIFKDISLLKQTGIISELPLNESKLIVNAMESDNAVELLTDLEAIDPDLKESLINALPKKKAAYLRLRLSYEEDTAGSIMNSEYLSIPENLSVKEALVKLKEFNPPASEVSFYIFVVDQDKKLVGITTLRDLVIAPETAKVKDFRDDYPIKVTYDKDQEEVARLFQKYDLIVLAVVDEEDHLMGVITVDDVVDVVVEEATEDLYKLSGTTEVEEEKLLAGNILIPVFSRLPWLIVTVFGGVLASYIINRYSMQFSSSIFSLSLSLSFVPLLMGLAGNVGNQSATITVRGLATGVIKTEASLSFLFRELIVGKLIGLITALFVYSVSIFFEFEHTISLIVAVSLYVNIVVAAVIGGMLPLIFKQLNIDPAVASAPFISTALDISGQIIYFSITLYFLATFT